MGNWVQWTLRVIGIRGNDGLQAGDMRENGLRTLAQGTVPDRASLRRAHEADRGVG